MRQLRPLALLLLLTSPALAELAPETYRAMQQAAPELVQIEVVSVDIDRDFTSRTAVAFSNSRSSAK